MNKKTVADDDRRIKFWTQYKTLPPALQDALFDDKTEEYITRICERGGEKGVIDFIIDKIGDVFLGYMAPTDFFKLIEKQLDCNPDIAKKIFFEISDSLLYPLRESLGKLYGAEAIKILEPTAPAQITQTKTTTIINPTTPAPNPRPTKISPGGVAPKAAVARPAAKPIVPIATARQKPTSAPAVPRIIINKKTAPAKPAAPGLIRPQTPPPAQAAPLPQDRPTLSAAPSGLRRKVF